MRKNGVNRELREIDGGVCAPEGFRANAIHCGFTAEEGKKDLALIVADRRCPAACVYAEQSSQSGTSCTTKRHMKRGLARAILVNGGVANLFLSDGERLAEMACRALAARSDIDCNDTVIASTGEIGREILLETFEKGLRPLVQGLAASEETAFSVATMLATGDSTSNHAAFSFDLGAFSCKIGTAFKGCTDACPTTLIFMTSDVNISSEMLQKALSLTVKDTVELLCVDGMGSPNDLVCMMANGRAENYKISCEDTEFFKFVYALRKVLAEICYRIAKDCAADGRVFSCKVSGAKSQQAARLAAKKIASSVRIRRALRNGKSDAVGILCAVNSAMDGARLELATVALVGSHTEVVLYDGGAAFSVDSSTILPIVSDEEVCLRVTLSEGNYSAMALGCFA